MKNSWRKNPIMWVIGCVDSNGAIIASPSKEGRTHSLEEKKGKRWRWSVWSQEFLEAGGSSDAFTQEEMVAVMNWLERKGYTDAATVESFVKIENNDKIG